MYRKDFIKGFLVAGVAAAALTLGAASASAQTKWNLPAAYPNDNPHTENLVLFAKDVEAATSGKLSITVHGNASLFKAPEIKRAVQTGQAQMGEVLLSLHENEDPVYGIDVVPFLATSFADSASSTRPPRPRSRRSSTPRASSSSSWSPGRRRASTPRRTSTRSRT